MNRRGGIAGGRGGVALYLASLGLLDRAVSFPSGRYTASCAVLVPFFRKAIACLAVRMRLASICVVLYLEVSFVTFGSKTPHKAKMSKLHEYAISFPRPQRFPIFRLSDLSRQIHAIGVGTMY